MCAYIEYLFLTSVRQVEPVVRPQQLWCTIQLFYIFFAVRYRRRVALRLFG